MGRKIFISYKYGDTQVKDLNILEAHWTGLITKVPTKARHYVDKLSAILERDDHIYKGEDDGQSLAEFSDDRIASSLRDKIYDSTITVVLVSKGMKNPLQLEKNQWMPWEISYSLKEITRNGRTCSSNAVLVVALPDELGSYEYYIRHDKVCNCRFLDTSFLFKILRDNMFNEKNATTSKCSDGKTIYHGDYSYIESVEWSKFIENSEYYLNKSIELRNKQNNYTITKMLS